MQWLIDIVKEWLQLYLQGMIVIWSGAIVDIPDGWHLCDGTEGTPDLREKFIPGAGPVSAPGKTGGHAGHVHDFTGDGHYHTGSIVYVKAAPAEEICWDANYNSSTEAANGQTDTTSHMPPYYYLAYIMKL